MFKSKTLMALGAVLAILAMPAVASAGWTHSGVELKSGENAQLSSVGSYRFEGELGGVECETVSQMTLTGGTTAGHMTKFEPNGQPTSKCKTLGLLPLIGCQKVESVQKTNLPNPFHGVPILRSFRITTGVEHLTMMNNANEHCVVQITINPGTVAMDIAAAEKGAISKFQYSGELETSEGEIVAISGSQSVTQNAGTYGMT